MKTINLMKRYWLFALVIVALILTFFELPYYVTHPGDAKNLSPLVEVENGYDTDGAFMLTTVLIGKANIINFVWAKVSNYRDLYSVEDIRREDESDEDYHKRQLHYMENSKETAIIVAYTKAKKEIEIKEKGIVVLSIIDGMPAEDVLKIGDIIISVDKRPVFNPNDLEVALKGKKKGTTVNVEVKRDGQTLSVNIPLVPFPEKYQVAAKERVGIGISHKVVREVIVEPKIEVNSEGIGGPSAGLMFTLAIYNQLVEKDLTYGLNIAGTGTITMDGIVGPIGGIKQKVVAADNAGAAIFFAPNENGDADSNYTDAVKVAKDIGTDMKIVPVDTFDDALQYLENLK